MALYRYFCRKCRHYEYSQKIVSTCKSCGEANPRKDLLNQRANTSRRSRPKSRCCGK